MKKFIMLILMVLPVCSVNASEWVEVDSLPVTEMSTLEIKEEKEYMWYALRKEGYFFTHTPSEEFVKTDIWKYSDWSDWSEEEKIGDHIETRTVYHYQNMKKIKYIRFSDISSKNVIFDSIALYEGRSYLPYQRYEDGDDIILELSIPCFYDDLEVNMLLINTEEMESDYTMEWLYELDLPSALIVEVRSVFKNSLEDSYYYRKMMPNEFLYEDEMISLERVEENRHRLVFTTEESRVQNKMYYYEREYKDYYSDYSSAPILDYLYPDWSTEKKRLFVKENIVDTKKEELNVTEKVYHEIIPVKTSPEIIRVESSTLDVKQELDDIKSTLVSCLNERSNSLEKESHIVDHSTLQKQSLGFSIYFLFFVLGFLLGRIMTMKKKV